MPDGERDSTGEWILPAEARPSTLAQLEQRIDHALAVARASEAAAVEIGAAALDAAEQARRAAALAERASNGGVTPVPAAGPAPAAEVAGDEPEVVSAQEEFDSFRHFLERAERVSARLEAIAPAVAAERG